MTRQRRWQLARKEAGGCIACKAPRDAGNANFCKAHRDGRNAVQRARDNAKRLARRRVSACITVLVAAGAGL